MEEQLALMRDKRGESWKSWKRASTHALVCERRESGKELHWWGRDHKQCGERNACEKSRKSSFHLVQLDGACERNKCGE